MKEKRERTLSWLKGAKDELEELRDMDNGCEQPEQVQLMQIVQMIEDLSSILKGTFETSQLATGPVDLPPIPIPLQLPYKEARMLVMHKFQVAYCSALVSIHGGTREAANAAKVERGNFCRILREAINSLREV